MSRRTLTMSWDGDQDDRFYESSERLSSAMPVDLGTSGSDDNDNDDDNDDDKFQDSRHSFSSAATSPSPSFKADQHSMLQDYNLWMEEPGDIRDRRKRLLQGMGMMSHKDLLRRASAKFARAMSTKKVNEEKGSKDADTGSDMNASSSPAEGSKQDTQECQPRKKINMVKSRSDGDILSSSVHTKRRKQELIGCVSKQHLTRTYSGLVRPSTGASHLANAAKLTSRTGRNRTSVGNSGAVSSPMSSGGEIPTFFLIKNLDSGTEFIVKEQNGEGMLNKLSNLQRGKQLSIDEFEKSVGYSPVVKEFMPRRNNSRNSCDGGKANGNSSISKSFKSSKKKWLKNIIDVANAMSLKVDKDKDKVKESSSPVEQKESKSPSKWMKAHQHGKPYKEFTALASAGEDGIIHVWEVQE